MSVPNDWYGVEGWLFENEALKLQELSKGKRVLEIGSYCGRSTVAMASVAKSLDCVDHFRGNIDDILGTTDVMKTKTKFLNNTNSWRNKINLFELEFEDFIYNTNPNDHYDFIFYDAGHDEEPVTILLEWIKKYEFQGCLALHDYNKPREFPGTFNAVNDFKKKVDYHLIGSLIILRQNHLRQIYKH